MAHGMGGEMTRCVSGVHCIECRGFGMDDGDALRAHPGAKLSLRAVIEHERVKPADHARREHGEARMIAHRAGAAGRIDREIPAEQGHGRGRNPVDAARWGGGDSKNDAIAIVVALKPPVHKGRHGHAPARVLDQFYTRPAVARDCVARVLALIGEQAGTVFIEPAAGAGAFLDALPEPRIGLDIAPARADIEQADFLRWWPPNPASRFVVVSNFPFGKNASLAVKFVNHAARFAEVVASILPRSFEKETIQRRVDTGFALVSEAPLPADSFLYRGEAYAVPVVFQIWRRSAVKRVSVVGPLAHPDFVFLRAPEQADFAFQRVGVRAGLVSVDGLARAAQSHYFIAVRNPARDVAGILAAIDWSGVKSRTAGNPSIGKAELVAAYQARIAQSGLASTSGHRGG